MSKKHFIAFAKEIAEMEDRKAAQVAADMVVRVSLQHNANFDAHRFLTACGL